MIHGLLALDHHPATRWSWLIALHEMFICDAEGTEFRLIGFKSHFENVLGTVKNVKGETDMEEKYCRAVERYDHRANAEDVEAALAEFESLGDYRDSAKYVEKCRTLLRTAPGRTMTMGSWNGTPIRWRVIAERGKQRLLFAEDVVARHPYCDRLIDATWSTCGLRRWLNGEFVKEAFTQEERGHIMFSKVENAPSAKYWTDGGPNTTDRLFPLRMEELDTYHVENRALDAWWWTRTPGMSLLSVAAVDRDGSVYEYGINNNYADGGVRPAMWILLRV